MADIMDYVKPDHGYPLLVTIAYIFIVNFYMQFKVVNYRKAHKYQYPMMYHPTDQMFNCIQRVHQNTLEWAPLFFSLFVPCGIVFPRVAAGLGAFFVLSRIPYAWGYYTGDPAKRSWGVAGELGLLGLFGLFIYITVAQFGLVP